MKRQIIFTLVVSLLSFGMIDSAVTKDKSNNIETMSWFRKRKRIRTQRTTTYKWFYYRTS